MKNLLRSHSGSCLKSFFAAIGLISCNLLNAQYWASPTEFDYGPMAREITAGADSKYEQAELIYRWLCDNIEYDVDYQYYTADETREHMKGVCHGYSELFYRIAEAAGLESKIIPGFSKNIKNKVGIDRHSWIIATTEKGEIFIDPTWGAGFVVDKVFHKSESDMSWFDVNPYVMASSHLPIESRFLLLDREIDDNTFRKVPFLYSCLEKLGLDGEKSFEKGLAGELSIPEIFGTIGEKMGFLEIPLDGVLEYGAKYKVEYQENENYDLLIRMDDKMIPESAWTRENGKISVDLTVTAMEKVMILAMPKGKTDGEASGGFGYTVRIPEVIPEEALAAIEEYDPYMLPELKNITHLHINWYKKIGIDGKAVLDTIRMTGTKAVPELFYDAQLIEILNVPLSSPLVAGKEYIFHFKSDTKKQWALINAEKAYLNWDKGYSRKGEFMYKFKIPEPGTLSLGVKIGETTYRHAITWLVIAGPDPVEQQK